MLRQRERADRLSIDLIALPLVFCLLAAVVGLFALDEATSSPCCTPPPCCTPEQRATELRRLISEAEELGLQQNALIRRLDYALTERDLSQKAGQADGLRQRASVVARIAEAEKTVAELQGELMRSSPAPSARPHDGAFGTYSGPYVLVECKNGHAIVYPGGWRIPSEPSDSEFAKLSSQVKQAGFVAFAVRPSGWVDNSFHKLRRRVVQEIGGAKIGRTEFPIDETEAIKPYLPG